MKTGFITNDGYAAVPYGKYLMVIYDGQQLEVFKSQASAKKYITQHKKQNLK
jgi:hypothetical protein